MRHRLAHSIAGAQVTGAAIAGSERYAGAGASSASYSG
jgi:hypothetical protein